MVTVSLEINANRSHQQKTQCGVVVGGETALWQVVHTIRLCAQNKSLIPRYGGDRTRVLSEPLLSPLLALKGLDWTRLR